MNRLISQGFFFTLLLSVFWVTTCYAEKAPMVNLPFQVYLWPGGPNSNLDKKLREAKEVSEEDQMMVAYVPPTIQYSPHGNESVDDIEAAVRRLSPVYRYSGANPLAFYREEINSNHKVTRVPLGAVSIPTSYQRALLLFMPDPENADRFRIIPIENSIEATPIGHANVYNFTGGDIACLFNNQQLLLKPGEHKLASLEDSGRASVVVRVGSENQDGTWRERLARQMFVNPSSSLTVLIYKKPGKADRFDIVKIENSREGGESAVAASR